MRWDKVMLFAGDDAIPEALIVHMAAVSEIDAEARAIQAESVAFRVRRSGLVHDRRARLSAR